MPDYAYLIKAHGNESDNYCVVPEGCLLVVKKHPGELSTFPKWDQFFNCSEDDLRIYLNPLQNIEKLEKKLAQDLNSNKSIAIYLPGQKCPNFYYSFNMLRNQGSMGKLEISGLCGIFQSPFRLDDKSLLKASYFDKEYTNLENSFIKYYTGSIYPTQEEIRTFISKNSIKNLGELNTVLLREGPFYATQEMIFDFVKSGRISPGVFYNLACRSHSSVEHDLMWKFLGSEAPFKPLRTPNDPEYRPYNSRYKYSSKSMYNLLPKEKGLLHPIALKWINEAERARKLAQYQKYLNKIARGEIKYNTSGGNRKRFTRKYKNRNRNRNSSLRRRTMKQ
jgi:hypothetical protein